MSKNISYITKLDMCSACGACVSICTKKCITFKQSSLGRLYASVNTNCINCGLCLKVCPSYTNHSEYEDFFSEEKLDVKVAKARNNNILLNGQSGGGVTAVLSFLFKTNRIDAALVCDSKKGSPIIVTNEAQLYNSQKSVYTPVTLLSILNEINKYTSVAIVGLPCHITGVTNVMRYKNNPIKYKIGLICDRQLCGTLASGILKYFGLKHNDGETIKWRDKNAGVGFDYSNAPISVWSFDKQIGIVESSVRQKLKHMFTPLRCRVCPDKFNINADIVFGDPWNIGQVDAKGSSLIIVNTQIGQELLRQSIDQDYLSVSRTCSSDELNASQHIKERRAQVAIYSRLLHNHNTSCYLLNQHNNTKINSEYLRALYCVSLFKFLELLPKSFIEYYVKRIIIRMNKK